MTHLVSRKRMGFGAAPLHRSVEPHAFHYLAQRASFWVAVVSLLAFVTGNMIGQHGWQVFWKSVLGRGDDSLIVYTGTAVPITLVPDYVRWFRYGGNPQEHSFREVPQDLLIPLPRYTSSLNDEPARVIYSVSYMGSYSKGREYSGSHPAVDIRVPVGTPVRAIASGIVSEVKDATGFGKTVVIRHPHMPDPQNPSRATVLYSCYAHLSTAFVTEGSIVEKGEQIALSGQTGDASGPHLHFQIDREEAPWHPYWPFTPDELHAAGLSQDEAINRGLGRERSVAFTINPLLYVQADYAPVTMVAEGNLSRASSSASSASSTKSATWLSRIQSRSERRKALRIVQRSVQTTPVALGNSSSAESSVAALDETVVERREVVVSRSEPVTYPNVASNVVSVDISHDGEYTERKWEHLRLTLLDAQGNVVTNPVLEQDIVLRAAYGSADFRPETLSVLDFSSGRAEASALVHGRRALVIEAIPFKTLSTPMRYTK